MLFLIDYIANIHFVSILQPLEMWRKDTVCDIDLAKSNRNKDVLISVKYTKKGNTHAETYLKALLIYKSIPAGLTSVASSSCSLSFLTFWGSPLYYCHVAKVKQELMGGHICSLHHQRRTYWVFVLFFRDTSQHCLFICTHYARALFSVSSELRGGVQGPRIPDAKLIKGTKMRNVWMRNV